MKNSIPISRLVSLDMLRGIAAMAVAAFHAYSNGHLGSALMDLIFWPITFGSAGVYLFFVISGFCIHMRWARDRASGTSRSALTFGNFWKRRITRLYPAYLATLLICIAIEWKSNRLVTGDLFLWDVVSHLFMVHNFDNRTLYSINGVFWTLAIEEQLYLAYFVLLWLRQRFGWRNTLLVCLGVRFLWIGFAQIAHNLGVTLVVTGSAQATWVIWALGALSVEAWVGITQLPRWASDFKVAAFIFIPTAMLAYLDSRGAAYWHFPSVLFQQLGFGAAAFVLVNACVSAENKLALYRNNFWMQSLLWLGLVSYSIYLCHTWVYKITGLYGLLGLVCALPVAGVFFLLFERPFMTSKGHAGSNPG